jgi:hypothetical protein
MTRQSNDSRFGYFQPCSLLPLFLLHAIGSCENSPDLGCGCHRYTWSLRFHELGLPLCSTSRSLIKDDRSVVGHSVAQELKVLQSS